MASKSLSKSYSDKVEKVLKKVLASEDPLEQANFDVIQHINEKFTPDTPLQDIDDYSIILQRKIKHFDEQIYTNIKEQSSSTTDASKSLKDAKDAIDELFKKISEIKGKAVKCEITVAEICGDIKKLDSAKKNLSVSIDGVKRLKAVIEGSERLNGFAAEKQYIAAATLLSEMRQYKPFQDMYGKVPKVADVNGTKILHAFRNISLQ